MAEITWLGDADPSVQTIEQFGVTFVKGEPTKVPNNHPQIEKLKGNQTFSVGKSKAEVVDSDEPEPEEEDGTELAAVRTELTARGIRFSHNAKLDTLRAKLAQATAE